MKRLLISLIMLLAIAFSLAAEGFLGATVGLDSGTVTYTDEYEIEYSYDFINGNLGLRGGQFFGPRDNNGLIYSLSVGHCFVMKDSIFEENEADDIYVLGSGFLGYGLKVDIGRKLDAIVGIGPAVSWYNGKEDTILWFDLVFSANGIYEISDRLGLLFGFDTSIVAGSSFRFSSAEAPEEETGVFLTPFLGCTLHY